MTGSAPPTVRFRISCPDLAAYQERLAPQYAADGIFIPSGRIRSRPIGSRVRLKIELGDRTLAYSGGAIVAAHVQEPEREGLILSLDPSSDDDPRIPQGVTIELELPEPAATAAPPATAPPVPTPAPTATPVPTAALTPVPRRATLSEAIFAEDEKPAPPPPPPEVVVAEEAAPAPRPVARIQLAPRAPEEAELPAEEPEPTPPPEPLAARPPRPSRRAVLTAAVVAGAVLCAAGAALLLRAQREAAAVEAAFTGALRVADERLRAGRLTAPAGDSALDHLRTAAGLRPQDGRVTSRLGMLADTLESLGERAAARDDLQEAAAHLSGALRADPGRQRARAGLEGVEARRRDQERRRRGHPGGAGASG